MATVPTFRTWVTGEIVTAAYMNTNIRDGGNFFLSVPVYEGRQTVAQSIGNSATTAVTMDTEDIDTDGGHSVVTNTSRYTPVTAGRYRLGGGVSYAANATGRRVAVHMVNGATRAAGDADCMAVTNGQPTATPARNMTVFLNGTTDYVEMGAFQDSGGALNTSVGTGQQPNHSVHWIGTT